MSNPLMRLTNSCCTENCFFGFRGLFSSILELRNFTPVFRYSHGRPNAAILIEFRIT